MTVYNKVTLNGETLIDISSDTVTSNTLVEGYTAHSASGEVITGNIVDGNLLAYGTSSNIVGEAKIGTGYVWTTIQNATEINKGQADVTVVA